MVTAVQCKQCLHTYFIDVVHALFYCVCGYFNFIDIHNMLYLFYNNNGHFMLYCHDFMQKIL